MNLDLLKKYDTDAMLEQYGNQHGDCHLPRGKLIFYSNINFQKDFDLLISTL